MDPGSLQAARNLLTALGASGQAAAWVVDGRIREVTDPWTSGSLGEPGGSWLSQFAPELHGRLDAAARELGAEPVEVELGESYRVRRLRLTPAAGGFVCSEVDPGPPRASSLLLADAERVAEEGSWHWDLTTGKIVWSAGLMRLYGVPPSFEPSFSSFLALVHPGDRAAVQARAHKLFSNPGPWQNRHRIVRPDGQVRLIEDYGRVVLGRGGDPQHVVAISRDVTAAAAAQAALSRYRDVVDAMPDGFVAAGLDGTIELWSRGAGALFGLGEEEARGRRVESFVPPEQREDFRRRWEQVLAGKPMVGFEAVRSRSDGTPLELSIDMFAMPDAEGRPAAVASVLRDLGPVRRAERAAREAAGRFEELFALTPLGLALFEHGTGRMLDVNRAGAALLGFVREALLGKTLDEVGVEIEPGLRAEVRATVSRGAPLRQVSATLRSAGASRPFLASFAAVDGPGGRQVLCAFQDLTEQKAVEQSLRDSEGRFALLFQKSPVPASLTDEETGQILAVNERMMELTGYSREELEQRRTAELDMYPDALSRSELLARLRRAGHVSDVELRLRHKSGSLLWVQGSATRLELHGRACVLAAMVDVTERRQLQQQLVLADRLVALGTLAAGMAHEINNPLAYVLSNVESVRRGLAELRRGGEPARWDELDEALGEAAEGAYRVRHIVRDLRAFSRPGELSSAPIDVLAAVESTLRMAAPELRNRATLVRALEPVPPVQGDAARLGQVVLNLVLNAAQAIAPGQPERNRVEVRTSADAQGRVVIEVADTGCGIGPEHRQRIFDPFFTTKPVGTGTGLGLSIVHGIVTGMGGEVEVETEPGRGSTFRLRLPASRAAVRAPAPGAPTAGARVLVVDDEPLVGRALQRLLQGHEVTVETRGEAALQRLRDGARYDVVLCDLMMPGLPGPALHAEICRLDPAQAARMVFMTGAAFSDEARAFLDTIPNPRLPKPFEAAEVRAAVDAVVGQGRPR